MELHCHGLERLLKGLHWIIELPWDPDSKVSTVLLEQVDSGNFTQFFLFWPCSETDGSNSWIHCLKGDEERMVGCLLPTLLLSHPLHPVACQTAQQCSVPCGWTWICPPDIQLHSSALISHLCKHLGTSAVAQAGAEAGRARCNLFLRAVSYASCKLLLLLEVL